MKEIIEKTKELGALIQKSEQVQKFNDSKAAYDNDEEIQRLIKEFNLHKMSMMTLTQGENPDQERISEVEERIKGVYEKIMQNEKMQDFQAASKAVQELLNQVNGVIGYYVTGEEPTDCTHDCSTCGGCH
ncbi:MAG: YlbF family regulator [Clostridia bacterium]|nr:YlbF family regulator [Clostridia bacterium]